MMIAGIGWTARRFLSLNSGLTDWRLLKFWCEFLASREISASMRMSRLFYGIQRFILGAIHSSLGKFKEIFQHCRMHRFVHIKAVPSYEVLRLNVGLK